MARLPRYALPGYPQHIIQRGNNRSIIFKMEADYHYYLEMLKKASEAHECLIHSYVLMTNHVQNEKSVKQSSPKLHK
jgi:putative transposase